MRKRKVYLLVSAVVLALVASVMVPKTEPADPVLWQKSIKADLTADPADSLGTVFAWRAPGLDCAAGFINAHSSTRATNQNDLEFWCRDTRAPSGDFKFRSLGRVSENFIKSSIANVDGELIEFNHGRIFNRIDGKWERAAGRVDRYPHPLGGHVAHLQRSGDRRWSFVSEWRNCDGVAVLSGRGYHGSLPGNARAPFLYRNRVYANVDDKIISYAVPPARAGPCRAIASGKVHVSEANSVYSMMPYGGAMIIGALGRGRPCAALYRVRQSETTVLNVAGCGDRRVTEFYSYMVYNDDLLVGTYPDGNLARVGSDAVMLTDDPIPFTGKRNGRHRYFEAQSMTIAAGDLVVGMYPWGQLYRRPFGIDAWRSQRLFSGPPISDEPHPYRDAMKTRISGLGIRKSRTKRQRRALGLFESAWGQRINALAVFNGELCASTGNMSGSPWNATYHSMVPESLAKEYGRVQCAPIANHTLGAIDWQRSTNFTFKVTSRRLVIEQDGREIASHGHSLAAEQTAALSRSGAFQFARGVYGRFQGTLLPRP